MEVSYNNRDLHYIKKKYGPEYVKQIQDNLKFIEYCMLLSGKHSKTLNDIFMGNLKELEKLKKDMKSCSKYVLTPCYSDKSLSVMQEYGLRNFILFQDSSGFNTITLLLNKAIDIEQIKKEYYYVKEVLRKDISFLVDSKISKKKMDFFLSFLDKENIRFFRLRWRGKKPTFKKLLRIKEDGKVGVHISNLNTNLGITERKSSKRIACLALLNVFRNEITSLSRGVSHFLEGDYPIYKYNHETWTIDIVNYSPLESEYIKSRIELVNELNLYVDSYFSKVDSKEFVAELTRKEIEVF